MKKKILSKEEVEHIAKLAKLSLTENDITVFKKQLSDIIGFVDQLSTMKTANIEPTNQVTGQTNVFREDKVAPSLSQEETLANAPRKHKGYFVVKAIFN